MSKTSTPMGGTYTATSPRGQDWPTVATPRIACLGELLWDVFPDGQRLGGAPANVAFHAARLGAAASLHSRIGQDELGDLALQRLTAAGVDVAAVERDQDLATGTVLVTLQHGEPSYTIVAPAAWDHIAEAPGWLAAGGAPVRPPHALVFGSLAARRRDQAERLTGWLRAARAWPEERPRLVLDVNLRRPFVPVDFITDALGVVDVLKLSGEELGWLGSTGVDLIPPPSTVGERAAVTQLFERFGIGLVLLTRGARGAAAYTPSESFEVPGIPITLGDTVGAGDAFLAAFLVARLRGEALPSCLDLANRRAAEVAASRGAMST